MKGMPIKILDQATLKEVPIAIFSFKRRKRGSFY